MASIYYYNEQGGGSYQIASIPFSPGLQMHTYTFKLHGNDLSLAVDGHVLLEHADNQLHDPGQIGLFSGYGAQISVQSFKVTPL